MKTGVQIMKKATVSKLTIYKTCPICGNDTKVIIRCNDDQYKDYNLYYKGCIIPYKPIQAIFPDISKQQRETIKSGICRRCQKSIF